jgi:hypothetical protein
MVEVVKAIRLEEVKSTGRTKPMDLECVPVAATDAQRGAASTGEGCLVGAVAAVAEEA